MRAAKSLHLKKHRREQRCFLVEAPTAVESLLDAPGIVTERIFVLEGLALPDALLAKAAAREVEVLAVESRTMHALSSTQTPPGIVAVARFFHQAPAALETIAGDTASPCTILILHDLADPGNAGTLMRSAEAFGAAAVCCGAGGVDPYNEKVARASLGSMFHLPLVCYEDWTVLAGVLGRIGVAVVAAEAGAPDVRSVTLPRRIALVVGNERHGVAAVPDGAVGIRVGIPQASRAESLNAAVAGSIVLYELSRAIGSLPKSDAPRTSDA